MSESLTFMLKGLLTTLLLVFATPAADALFNTVRWKTASEVENFGYDVYRSEAREGPFKKLTSQPIAGAGTTDEPQSYELRDDSIEEGKVYFYFVESISMNGDRERFTPIFQSKAKYRAP